MDAQQFIVRQLRWMRRQTDSILTDLSEEQFNWAPPGTANPIGVILVHMLVIEDEYVQQVISGKPRLWEAEGWQDKVGTPAPERGANWDALKDTTMTLESAVRYQLAVRAATDAYIAGLTPEEFDRRVSFLGGERRVADVLSMLVIHHVGHAGEIAALKGVQGATGLGF
jgi:uncharacterized damage-inducible protein DinB